MSLSASRLLECGLSCEINESSRSVYSENFRADKSGTSPSLLELDITRLPSSVMTELNPTIIAGGFPCQSFASHGKREGFENPQTGGLFMHVVRLVSAARPKVVLLENVRGLLNHEGGQTMSVVIRSLEKLGYHVHYELMNAKSLLPQIRSRVLIVAFLEKTVSERFRFPILPNLNRTLLSELEVTSPEEGGFVHLTDTQWNKINSTAYFKEFPESRVADLSGPARTLCSLYKTGAKMYSQFIPVQEGGPPRFLTIRECCRLQGFPQSFLLPHGFEPRNEFYKMIGNAVPVPLITSVALEVERALWPERGVDSDMVMAKLLKDASREPEEVERKWHDAMKLLVEGGDEGEGSADKGNKRSKHN